MVMKAVRVKKKWINDYNTAKTLVEDLEVIYEFFKEEEATLEDVEGRFEKAINAVEDLEFKNMLSEEGRQPKCCLANYSWCWWY